MKVRWREEEKILITLVVFWQMLATVLKFGDTSFDYSVPETLFREQGLSFDRWRNAVIPQVASLGLAYGIYMAVVLALLPYAKKVIHPKLLNSASRNLIIPVSVFLVISVLLTIGSGVISFFGRPHLFNYGEYKILALLGYNDKPLANVLFGLDRAMGVVTVLFIGAIIREAIIQLIESPGRNREYRIMVFNNATPLALLYFLLLVISNPTHDDFVRYVVFVTPLMALYIYETFWLFPQMTISGLLNREALLRLFTATIICTIPSLLLFFGSRIFVAAFYWVFLSTIATGLFWMIYQVRKDKILQLKQMQVALATSDANLQFLKAQINPHFLFNALNTLYGTALKGDTDKTAEGIQRLGDMMRFMLHENSLDRIPLQKEIEYVKNFITLQRLRLPSSPDLIVEEEIEDTGTENLIAPMLLIPFVENAFKHGISLKEKSWIKVALLCRGNTVQLAVINSIHRDEDAVDEAKSGIGLKNVRGRLDLQYPNKYELDIHATDKEFTVNLLLTC